MSHSLLAQYITACFDAQPPDIPVTFTWQGGEPTLAGLDFYLEAVRLQRRHGDRRRFENSFQTNGLLIDDRWAEFFAENDFLVGLSLDGPADIHDAYRRGPDGGSSHAAALRALRVLQRHNVRVNTLSCVSTAGHGRGRDVYQFLKNAGVRYLQFTPVVERSADAEASEMGLRLGMPDAAGTVTGWSVGGDEFGIFLSDIFSEWVKKDVGTVFVMNFGRWRISWRGQERLATTNHYAAAVRCWNTTELSSPVIILSIRTGSLAFSALNPSSQCWIPQANGLSGKPRERPSADAAANALTSAAVGVAAPSTVSKWKTAKGKTIFAADTGGFSAMSRPL
jgi:Arylsulfatase regulator (Fe-S oxidoreductase)